MSLRQAWCNQCGRYFVYDSVYRNGRLRATCDRCRAEYKARLNRERVRRHREKKGGQVESAIDLRWEVDDVIVLPGGDGYERKAVVFAKRKESES